jgi:AbiJ-like protein
MVREDMKFSDKHGYTKAREVFQLEVVDEPLRNRIWTLLKIFYWDRVSYTSDMYGHGGCFLSHPGNENIEIFCKRTWHNYYKEPLDTLSNDWKAAQRRFREEFFQGEWYNVYNFIEWVAGQYPDKENNKTFMGKCNEVLEEEMAAYRFVNGQITPITDKNETEAIGEAANSSTNPVVNHLKRSLELLSDRKQPDYRNSIKEAISAVEALAIILTGEKATLGQLLKNLDEHVFLHPALKGAFEKLYGFTSDRDGIRHALMEQEKVDFEDAKFMLVTCSAFINFVKGKLK